MAVGGKKRNLEAQADGLTEMNMNTKRLKSSEDPEQTDGGPKSATRTEPDASKTMIVEWKEGRTPLGIYEKVYY